MRLFIRTWTCMRTTSLWSTQFILTDCAEASADFVSLLQHMLISLETAFSSAPTFIQIF